MRARTSIWLTMWLTCAGCAGRTGPNSEVPSPSDGGADVVEASAPGSACPDTASPGAICAGEGELCTYGDSALPSCRQALVCRGSSFVGLPADTPCATTTCGPDVKTLGACVTEGDTCAYDDGTVCACSSCISPLGGCNGHDPWWHCHAAPADPCPAHLPNAGTACSTPTTCMFARDTGVAIDGVCAVCAQGTWTWFPITHQSPPSLACPAHPSCDGSCVAGTECPAGSQPISTGICSIGSTCCSVPTVCSTTAQCGPTQCCVGGACASCGGPCASERGLCVDTTATCDTQRQDGAPQPVVLPTCRRGGPCCTDPARPVCCQTFPGG